MTESSTIHLLGRSTRFLIAGAALGLASSGAFAQVAVEADTIDLQLKGQEAPPLDLTTYQPGFSLQLAEDDLQEQIADLNQYINESDWAKAFRLLTDLKDEQLQVMAPTGGSGQHVLVKEQLQRQLLSLPPEGRRAFRLYFDGQADEQFDKIKNHPLPGSEDQLLLAQALVDRLLASSVGGEAAVLLGDMYFERGMFDQADRNWGLALEHGSATGQQALTLQAKRTLALKRAGKSAAATALFNSLQARYGSATIQAGGESIDAVAMLGESIDQLAAQQQAGQGDAATPKNLLPARGAMPLWHAEFLSPPKRSKFNEIKSQRSYYSPPTDLAKFVPPVVSDDQRVYFQWLGVVFALDRQTGKQLWSVGKIENRVGMAVAHIQSNQGDPRNYRIAISDDRLLVTTIQKQDQGPFVLKAYDIESGELRWSSDTRQDWSIGDAKDPQNGTTALLGEVTVHEGSAYAVVHRSGQNSLFLRRFDPTDGKVDWTIPLGSAEVIAFQYTNVSRMPQPTLLMGSSLLYVMTNNGALLAVDVIAGEAQWALRMTPPLGIGQQPSRNFNRNNQLSSMLNTMANANGSSRLLLQDGTLYAKEHNGKTLYALDPSTGKVNWSADKLKPDAKLIAVQNNRFYLMDRGVQCYQVDGEHDLITKNGNDTGQPDHAGAIVLEDSILLYGDQMLRQLDTTKLDPAGKYENDDYLGSKGGLLYHFDDLLIAIDSTQITAFKISNDDNN